MIAFVLENHKIRDKYVQKLLLHIQNKSNFLYLWSKEKKRPNPYGMFSQNLPISVAFSAILKKRGYHNATQAALIGAKGKIKTGDDSAADLKCLKAG